MQPEPEEVTQILDAVGAGDPQAAEKLLPLVYEELRRLAAAKMARESPGQTLQPTALVHEAWLRLAGSDRQRWRGRDHFFRAAADCSEKTVQRHWNWPLQAADSARKRSAKAETWGVVYMAEQEEPVRRRVALPGQNWPLSRLGVVYGHPAAAWP
jgi:RNA polymerase sigma factor (TIGR02999 family)